MLFVPEKVPQCVLSDFATAFPPALASSDPVLARQIAGIIKSRNLFHQFVATSANSADMNQEKYQHQVSEVRLGSDWVSLELVWGRPGFALGSVRGRSGVDLGSA